MSLDTRGRAAGAAVRAAVQRVSAPNSGVVVRRRERRRRTRASVVALVVLLVAAAVAIPLLTRDDDRLTVASTSPRTADQSQVGDRFVPATTTSGDTTTMPITLPDGRPYTVRYAKGLDLAQLGFRSMVAATLQLGDGARPQTRTLSVLRTTAAERYPRITPVATYPDPQGHPIPYYVDPTSPDRGGLALQLGPWLVVVPDLDDPANHPDDHLTPDQRAVWAQNLGGWVDAAGFPVLAPGRALTLGQTAKGSFVLGPPLSRSKNNVAIGERWLCEGPGADTTTPRRFPPTPRGATKGAAWCDEKTGLHVSVVGTKRFVDRAIETFRIEPFSTASHATRIVLSSGTVAAGSTLPGVVVVVNNTGDPLTYPGCGGLFQVALTQGGAPPEVAWSACRIDYTVPEGESTYPVTVSASAVSCAVDASCPKSPGRYEAVLAQSESDLPPAKPVPVRVVPAR